MRVAALMFGLLLSAPALADGAEPLLRQLPPEVGWLTVRSVPEGLEVRLNGEPAGKTPLDRRESRPGEVLVTVSGPCHRETSRRVVVQAGQAAEVTLVPEERTGTLMVSASDPGGREIRATVAVDGLKVGVTPGGFEVGVCATQVLVSHPEQGARWEAIQIQEGGTLVVDVVLDGTFPDRPLPRDPAAKASERSWLLGLRVATLFDTKDALRVGHSKLDPRLFDTTTGLWTELGFDFRPVENFFLGAGLGLLYTQVSLEDEPDPDLLQAELGAHLGAVVSATPSLEFSLRLGLGVSFLLGDLAGPASGDRLAWRFEPGYASVGMKLAVGASWFLLDALGLSCELGLNVLLTGTDDALHSQALSYGPLVHLGLGVVYAL